MTPPTPPPLEALSLYHFFHDEDDEVQALRGVSLRVERGELVAIVGPTGCGKTALLACLAGIDEPTGGQVRVHGHVLTQRDHRRRAVLRARYIGALFQSGTLAGHLDVGENLRVAQGLAGRDDADRRRSLLEELGLGAVAGTAPAELSSGEFARASLAVALVNDPPVLVVDEPSDVDSVFERSLVNVLQGRAERGRAVVLATHSQAVAAAASRVVSMADGKLLD